MAVIEQLQAMVERSVMGGDGDQRIRMAFLDGRRFYDELASTMPAAAGR